jgi:putative oxygen-independent coproporphyrinogen III oxidase
VAGEIVIGIYIHVPYCRTLCPYCDFVKQRTSGDAPDVFVEAVCGEIAAYGEPLDAATLFLGGGTPSLLRAESLGRILNAVADRFAFTWDEVTIEANPDDITSDLVEAWRALGINRVSLGVQSFDDEALRYLGRRHDAAGALRACEAVAARFENWSLDLMFGAHPMSAWDATLAQCAAQAPKHVSVYGLTYEASTPFGKRSDEAIDDDTYVVAYEAARDALSAYDHYEVSNFALPGYACRHNLIYWYNEVYVGFGPGAYSFVDGVRSRNEPSVDGYLAAPGAKAEELALSEAEVRVETVIQHLRLRAGLSRGDYSRRFGRCLDEDYGAALAPLVDRGLLTDDGAVLRPSVMGYELNNEIGLALVDAAALAP